MANAASMMAAPLPILYRFTVDQYYHMKGPQVASVGA
jgi:hypothetical protein